MQNISQETNEISSSDETNLSARASNENNKPDIHTQIVLGNKLINAYSVKNMQEAFNYYNHNVANSQYSGKIVEATHYYIKITPSTEDELAILNTLDDESSIDTPVLHDHPVDYEVLVEGDYYINPQNEEDLYHPVYTTIPVDYQLPSGIKYEILDELYEPTDEEYMIETTSLYFAGWKDDLESDGLSITSDEELKEYFASSALQKSSNKFYPTGRITIENTGTGITEGLMKAEISYGRIFWWHYTYTDNNGNFNGNAKKYRGNVQIRAKWRGETATIRKTWNEVLGFFVSDYLMTNNKYNNGQTRYIDYTTFSGHGNHLWAKGTVNNGLRKYVDYCNLNGITNTISHANVWAWEGSNQSGATPMLYKYQQLPLMASFANIGQANFWHNLASVLSGLTINLVPQHLRPDQIYTGVDPRSYENNKSDSRRIHQLIFHESGHYSHAAKVGATYWAQLFASEISNIQMTIFSTKDPYRDGTYPSLQAGARIGLGEGWATFTEFNITNFYYQNSIVRTNIGGTSRQSASVVNGILESFNIYDRPMSSNRYDDANWFAHGLMYDLMDPGRNNGTVDTSVHRNGSGVYLNNILDEVRISTGNDYNLNPIFSRLTSSVNSAADLKTPLQSAYPAQSSQINTLFQNYGY
ncbi:MAG: hypothetical protein EOO42_18510 [Flavobacteriales bacterium]|nr:MAG: hypothetical protein EOO42_18510 [Flavobacteriales bacterium]